jgi:hypothetical protein
VEAGRCLREGIEELIHPSATSSFAVAYVVLAISTVFDLVSFRRSAGQMARQARRYQREFLEESRITSQPSLRAVFLEDAVSIAGDVTAFAAVALNQVTGSSVPQPFRPAEEEKARAFLLGYPGVTAVRQLLATFVGPGQVWIVALVDIDDGLRGAQVTALARGIEAGLKHEWENIYRVDIVPIGGPQAPPVTDSP